MDLKANKQNLLDFACAFAPVFPKAELVTETELNEAFDVDCFMDDIYVAKVTPKIKKMIKENDNVFWLDDFVYGTMIEAGVIDEPAV